MIKEFKEFAMKGNVVDLSSRWYIGGALRQSGQFNGLDVLMRTPIGALMGGVDFGSLAITVKSAGVDAAGKTTLPVLSGYGKFINHVD